MPRVPTTALASTSRMAWLLILLSGCQHWRACDRDLNLMARFPTIQPTEYPMAKLPTDDDLTFDENEAEKEDARLSPLELESDRMLAAPINSREARMALDKIMHILHGRPIPDKS